MRFLQSLRHTHGWTIARVLLIFLGLQDTTQRHERDDGVCLEVRLRGTATIYEETQSYG